MNLENVTNDTIKLLYESCTKAYKNDRSLNKMQKQAAEQLGSDLTYFGVDEYSDWPEMVRELQEQMKKRKIDYTPINL